MDDCKALDEVRDLLLRQQVNVNARLKHEHDKLSQTEQLRARHRDLIREIKVYGRAVRQSVELQHQADAAIDRGDVEEAKRLMAQAAQALPDPSNLPAAPRDVSDTSTDAPVPDPSKGNGPAPVPQPAPPAPEQAANQAAPAPKESGAHRAPAPPSTAPSDSDSSGMEGRIKAHIDQGFGDLRARVEQRSLPDGFREVFDGFSPEDLEMALKVGRKLNRAAHWRDSKKGNPFKKSDKSEPSHDNGVAEDGDPQH